jgi:hypothetical protein
VFPNSVKVGVDVLREAGWTTQIPSTIEVAVPTASSLYDLPGFTLSTRTAKWFQRVAPGTDKVQQGIDRLQPAWALADMLARAQDARVRNAWLLDPEDLDLESARRDKKMGPALQAFGLGMDCVEDVGYEHIYAKFKNDIGL